MDDRFRADFRRGLSVGLIVVSVVAFLAGLTMRAWAGDVRRQSGADVVGSRMQTVDSRMGERPVSAVEQCP